MQNRLSNKADINYVVEKNSSYNKAFKKASTSRENIAKTSSTPDLTKDNYLVLKNNLVGDTDQNNYQDETHTNGSINQVLKELKSA